MLKFSDNPPVLFPIDRNLVDMTGRWSVVHTKPRAEKAMAKDLVEHNIPYFLPMIEQTTFSGGRKRRGMMPLFASYIFVNSSTESAAEVRRIKHLVNLIPVPDQRQFVEELSHIHRLLLARVPLVHFASIAVGSRVRIARGPFKDLEGTVVASQGRTQFVLQVSLLGCGAAMDIDADLLQRLDS